MGKAYNFKCTNCDYNDQFFEGNGFMDHEFFLSDYVKNMQGSIHYKTYEKLLNLNNKYPHATIQIKEVAFKCLQCNCIISRPIFKVANLNELVYEKKIKCSHCNSLKVKQYKISKKRIEKCPKCKQQSLQFETIMLWD